jgi:hypothetical protein
LRLIWCQVTISLIATTIGCNCLMVENGEKLGKLLSSLAETVAKRTPEKIAKVTGRTSEQQFKSVVESVQKPQTKEAFQKSSKDWLKNASSTKAVDKATATAQIRSDLFTSVDIADARPALQAAIQARGSAPAWLPDSATVTNRKKLPIFTPE